MAPAAPSPTPIERQSGSSGNKLRTCSRGSRVSSEQGRRPGHRNFTSNTRSLGTNGGDREKGREGMDDMQAAAGTLSTSSIGRRQRGSYDEAGSAKITPRRRPGLFEFRGSI